MTGPGKFEMYAFAVVIAIAGGIAAAVGDWSGQGVAEGETAIAADYKGPRMVVFETSSCGWCKQLRKDLGPHYSGSAYQSRAPLTYVRLWQQRSYTLSAPVNATPTLVLVDGEGKELDRVIGHPGEIYPLYAMVERNL